jgi:hypothetical protein
VRERVWELEERKSGEGACEHCVPLLLRVLKCVCERVGACECAGDPYVMSIERRLSNGAEFTKRLSNGAEFTKRLANGAEFTMRLSNGAELTKRLYTGAELTKRDF